MIAVYTDAQCIEGLELSEVLEAYDKFMLPSSAVRRKLSQHLSSKQLEGERLPSEEGVSVVTDETLFKRSLTLSVAAAPVREAGALVAHIRAARDARL